MVCWVDAIFSSNFPKHPKTHQNVPGGGPGFHTVLSLPIQTWSERRMHPFRSNSQNRSKRTGMSLGGVLWVLTAHLTLLFVQISQVLIVTTDITRCTNQLSPESISRCLRQIYHRNGSLTVNSFVTSTRIPIFTMTKIFSLTADTMTSHSLSWHSISAFGFAQHG